MSGSNTRIISGKHGIARDRNGLPEYAINPELNEILERVREGYKEHKIKERLNKAKRRRHYRIGVTVSCLALLALVIGLKLWGIA